MRIILGYLISTDGLKQNVCFKMHRGKRSPINITQGLRAVISEV